MAKKVYFIGGPFAGRIMAFRDSQRIKGAVWPKIDWLKLTSGTMATPFNEPIETVDYELRPWNGHFIATPNGAPPLDDLIDFYFKEPHDHG